MIATRQHGPLPSMLRTARRSHPRAAGPRPARTTRLRHVAAAMLTALAGLSPAAAETLTGTAQFRERIALPPDAVFEAVIEDISRAGAPAVPLAGTVIEGPGQSPIRFAIDYDPGSLRPQAIYAVRATIRHEGRLMFTTDSVVRVLQGTGREPVDLLLKMAGPDRSGDAGPSLGAHGLRLPATFRGTLPCADCEGIRHHLDLWPGQHYHMRREWLGGADGTLRRDAIGRWSADPVGGAIVLHDAGEMPLFWQVQGPDRLRQMDMAGNPIESGLDYTLTSDGTLQPTELQDVFLLGMMTYLADAAVFEECLSGVTYPIAQVGDYLELERAYLDARPAPGAPLKVHVEGGLEMRPAMEGPDRMSLVVKRFIAVRPGETCDRPEPEASLTDVYWRIDTVRGERIGPHDGRREPHIVLAGGDTQRFRASVGCNQMIGRFEQEGEALRFEAGASTMMACPPPLDTMERNLIAVLNDTRSFRLEGQSLVLQDDAGGTIAELAAVYLR